MTVLTYSSLLFFSEIVIWGLNYSSFNQSNSTYGNQPQVISFTWEFLEEALVVHFLFLQSITTYWLYCVMNLSLSLQFYKFIVSSCYYLFHFHPWPQVFFVTKISVILMFFFFFFFKYQYFFLECSCLIVLFLLYKKMNQPRMCCVLCLLAQFETLWTVACQAPLSMAVPQARILKWVATPPSRGSSKQRDWAQVSCFAGRFFTIWAAREAQLYLFMCVYVCVCVCMHACVYTQLLSHVKLKPHGL